MCASMDDGMGGNSFDESRADVFVDPQEGSVDWRGLEQAAFDGLPEVQQAVLAGIEAVLQGPPKGELPRAFLLGLAELGPLLAFGAVFIGRAVPGSQTVSLTVVIVAGLVFIVQQSVLWRSMAQDVREIDGRRIIFAWVNAAVSLFTLLWIFTSGSESPPWWFGALVTGGTTLAAVLTAVRTRRLGKRVSGDQLETAMKLATPVGRSRAAIESLSGEQRSTVKNRLDALIQRLEAQGAISASIAEDAMRQPLGSLGRWALAMRQRTENE